MALKKVLTMMLMCALLLMPLGGCATETAEEVEEPEVAEEEALQLPPLSAEDAAYTVRVGYYNCDHMTAAVIMKDAGLFEKYGLMKTEVVGNGNVPQAMAAAQMDAGYIGTQGLMRAVMKGSPILVAADNHIGGSYYILASNDITDPQQLLGQKVVFGTEPEKNNASWVRMAKEIGLPIEGSNYESFDMSNQDAYIAMKTGDIKAGLTCDPWASYAEYEGVGHAIAVNMYLPGTEQFTECCSLSMSVDFYENHPELARRLIMAHADALKMIYTEPVKCAEIFARNYGVPEEVALMTIWKKTVMEGRTMTWEVDEGRYQDLAQSDHDAGILPEVPSTTDFIRTDILEAAELEDFETFIKENVDDLFPVGMEYEDWKAKATELAG
ncbi:MAG TPA: periplasmic-binding protein-like II family lipoprotein [Coriobacteriia bacterium]|nr:MAG: ABC-type nitrate/sulfonate/bicarbonate transport system, periplasmic component [Actinobacteria bacterium 66_15]HAL29152.1 periplasmic-binding protein-like II family lipoprotein [Coriobacteriia bacterium]